jgi:tetratricopeptide (TPR) repeat protein
MTNVSAKSPQAHRPWLFNAPLDLLIGCGGWSLPLIAFVAYATKQNAAVLASAFYFLTVFCNNPHYMATLYRAYGTGADFNRYRFFTIYVTVLLVLTVTLVHLVPALFPWVVTLYLLWSPWHYTGQNFGIAMLLARRAGAQPDLLNRQLLFASYVAAYAVWLVGFQSIETPDPGLIVFRLPRGLTNALLPVLSASFVALAGMALVRIARASHARTILGPALLSFSQGLWFIVPPLWQHYGALQLPSAYYSAGVLAFMHCAQYLWITTYHARREVEQGGNAPARPFHFVRYYAVLIVGGLALFIPGPWVASRLLGHEFVESFLIFAALVNLHHFILDGAIWKLRDNRLARLLIGRNAPAKDEEASDNGLPELLRWLAGKTAATRAVRYSFAAGVVALGVLDQAQFNLSQKQAELPQLAQAQSLNPQDTRVYFRRAQLLLREGNRAAAEDELRKAIAINPRNVAAQQLLGEILFKGGDAVVAFTQYNRMSELFPADVATLINRGLLARQLGSNAFAARSFEDALRVAPERIQLHYLQADALAAAGQAARAAEQFALYIKLHESGSGAPEELPLFLAASLRLGELHAAQKRWHEAERYWQRAADIGFAFRCFNDVARLLEKVAEAQEHLGRSEAAASSRRAATQASQLAQRIAAANPSQ